MVYVPMEKENNKNEDHQIAVAKTHCLQRNERKKQHEWIAALFFPYMENRFFVGRRTGSNE
jgi:hypothetical protein|tara:strand:- start:1814 stop:1996 length:183 start_codon:yes stop_codon:yes gene_type:complete